MAKCGRLNDRSKDLLYNKLLLTHLFCTTSYSTQSLASIVSKVDLYQQIECIDDLID